MQPGAVRSGRANEPGDARQWGAMNKARVAGLSRAAIAAMTESELVEVIGVFERPLRDQLEALGRETLEQLARQARRCCRLQGY